MTAVHACKSGDCACTVGSQPNFWKKRRWRKKKVSFFFFCSSSSSTKATLCYMNCRLFEQFFLRVRRLLSVIYSLDLLKISLRLRYQKPSLNRWCIFAVGRSYAFTLSLPNSRSLLRSILSQQISSAVLMFDSDEIEWRCEGKTEAIFGAQKNPES